MPFAPLRTALVAAVLMAAALGGMTPAGPALADPSGGAKSAGQSRDGQNRRIRVHNQTGWTITALYATDPRRADWRGDLMTGAALATGDSVLINVDDGAGACVYVLRAEFSNGQALERVGVNVCRIADYYFTR